VTLLSKNVDVMKTHTTQTRECMKKKKLSKFTLSYQDRERENSRVLFKEFLLIVLNVEVLYTLNWAV